jgi:GDP-D-mannose dehydratase
VQIDSSLNRGKAELHDLVGDPSKARERLGWEPTVGFEELVHGLVDADVERLQASSHTPVQRGAGGVAP